MQYKLEIRDPIHGFIYREPHEQEIIDTPLYQRLRRIRQLALATLVYPGAVHTRFDHSLGAFHIASKLCSRLLQSERDRRLVRLAALLHDVGHGPFSHVSEEVLERLASGQGNALKPGQQFHELITAQIVRRSPDLAKLLSDKEREQVVALLSGEWGDSLLKGIISGPIDVDKQDYLLRDSHFCGVKYGVYDLDQLTQTLSIHEDSEDRYLALSLDGIHVLEQFVLARYYMTTQVYRHRVRLISDEMIVRGICLGMTEDKIEWLQALYSYDGTDEFLQNYLSWYDDRLIARVLDDSTPEGYAKEFFRRLFERRLLKRIFSGGPTDFKNPEVREYVFEENTDFMALLEQRIAKQYGFDRNLVVAKVVEIKSVREQAAKSEGQIIVLHPEGPRMFHEESALFSSINQAIQEQFFEVYAPVTYMDEREKKRKRKDFHSDILAMIQELTDPQNKLFKEPNLGGETK